MAKAAELMIARAAAARAQADLESAKFAAEKGEVVPSPAPATPPQRDLGLDGVILDPSAEQEDWFELGERVVVSYILGSQDNETATDLPDVPNGTAGYVTQVDVPGQPDVVLVRFPAGEAYMKGDWLIAEEETAGVVSRPMLLLRLLETQEFLNLIARFESAEIPMGAQTALAFSLNAAMSEVYQESSVAEAETGYRQMGNTDEFKIPGEEKLSQDMRDDLRAVRNAISPDFLMSFMTPPPDVQAYIDGEQYDPNQPVPEKEQKRDWRPFSKALDQAKTPIFLLETTVDWEKILPDPVLRVTGITRSQAKRTALAFAEKALEQRTGDWTEAEFEEARLLVQEDVRLKTASQRMDTVVRSMGEAVSGAFTWIPLAFGLVVAALLYFCVSSLTGGAPSDAPITPNDLQSLPLLGLEKKA